MSSQSMTTTAQDVAIKGYITAEYTDKENFDAVDLLSSTEAMDENELYSEFFGSVGVNKENKNNNKKSSSQRKNKSTKRLRTNSVLSSFENIPLAHDDITTLSRRSTVWQYAIRNTNKNFATCNLCDDKKQISTNNGSTSTLRKHLILVHNLHHLALPSKKKENSTSTITLNRKRELDSLLINCIIKDGRTFGDFYKLGLKKILHELVPGIFSANIRKLFYLYSAYKTTLCVNCFRIHSFFFYRL